MRRHPLDLLSLLSGLTTVLLAVAAMTDPWSLDLVPWVVPAVLAAAGVVVLGAVAVAGRGERADHGTAGTSVSDGRGDVAPLDEAALREELLADQDPTAPWTSDTVELAPDEER